MSLNLKTIILFGESIDRTSTNKFGFVISEYIHMYTGFSRNKLGSDYYEPGLKNKIQQ